jgi:methionyl-tRNA formyltransferase
MKIVFMGTPEFSVPGLEMLIHSDHRVLAVVTQPDRPKGRGLKLEPSPVKQVALEHNLEALQPEKIVAPEFLARLRGLAPDLIVVIAFGQILKKDILTLPPLGCLNVHASLLPRFRGAAPIAWAILNGESETGITTMQMEEGLDTGPILMQKSIAIAPDETGGTLHDRLAKLGAEILNETLSGLEKGSLTPKPQDASNATFAPLLKKEQGRIDWSKSAQELERQVRAFDPWPGSFFVWQDQTIKVWKAKVVSGTGKPGEVLAADKEGITVACKAGALRITELQPPGKRRMSAAEFLRGHRILKEFLLSS